MKKVFALLVMVLVAVQFAVAGKVITQDAKQLPLPARNFINQYFSSPQISYIKIDSELLNKTYEVLLVDRTEIEFDGKGNWTEVDCNHQAVPDALVPEYVKSYINTSFPGTIVVKIERDRGTLEVELSNDYSLKFNKKGQLIDIDD